MEVNAIKVPMRMPGSMTSGEDKGRARRAQHDQFFI